MKILMITPPYGPIIGGTEAVVKKRTVELSGCGHEVDVLTFNMDAKRYPRPKPESYMQDGINVIIWAAFGVPVTRFELINRTLKTLFHLAFIKTFMVHALPMPGIARILKEYDILHYHDDVELVGSCSDNELVEWYRRAAIFVCLSLKEILPLVVMEAKAWGVPVVASSVGGIPEIVEERLYEGIKRSQKR